MVKTRGDKVIEGVNAGKSVYKASLEAGYSPSYAKARGKRILKTAVQRKLEDTLDTLKGDKDVSIKESKRLMSEILGISPQIMFERLRFLALEQDKDYSTSLKILVALAKEHGVALVDEESKTIVPVLHIGVREISPTTPALEAIEGVAVVATPTVEGGVEGG